MNELKLIIQRCYDIQIHATFSNIMDKSSLIFYYKMKLKGGGGREEYTACCTRKEIRGLAYLRKDFSSSLCVQTGSGAHPASCTMGTGAPFLGGKARPGRDADHSPPSSAEVVNE
jgi:hypothetical protein